MLPLPSDRFLVIAGPCVIESRGMCMDIAAAVKSACDSLGLPYVFKASFDKANRSSGTTFRGPGLEAGLDILREVGATVGVPVLTDVHEAAHCGPAAVVCDVLQVPAFLARQTDLLLAAGRTGRIVNVKKGQFMSPAEMGNAVDKIRSTGNRGVWLTERGTFFGYHRLVNDFAGLPVMRSLAPVVFDITHSTQQPAALGTASGGDPRLSPLLARAAIAAGVDGLFLECHPDPANARSDAATMLNLDDIPALLSQCARLAASR